jgi:hypothetical protein
MPHFSQFEWMVVITLFAGFGLTLRLLNQIADYLHQIQRNTDPDRGR